ncbi:uncharacterized protein LOC126880860 [Diabrotica virgifera virgifera]|uniref:Uncharacterized protein n=1 Tax=Diabrotica virgifera virgifera TaxID=50390 RepID=A0ABM5JSH1_DIAVI|nr:uncharacterized protein LOC126880860 [Diabrotica virgifera virgifera]
MAPAYSTLFTPELVQFEPVSLSNHGFSGLGHYHDGNSLFQKSAQLAHIARSSAVSAKNAVHNQHSAGSNAEFGVKSTLANVAVEASKTAQTALKGKQAILSNIKHQIVAAQNQLKDEITQYHQASLAAHAAQQAAYKAQSQLHSLRSTINEAEATAHDATAAAAEAANAEATQKGMLFEAKQKLEALIHQLKHVGGDLKDIQISALKATKSAQLASINAANSGHSKQITYGY